MKILFSRRTVAAVLLLASMAALPGCGTPSKVISPGPIYAGEAPVTRLYVYYFVDARPEYVHPAFKKALEQELSKSFAQASVAAEKLWFMDTYQGERLQKNMKDSTHYDTTFVSVGKTIAENGVADTAFRPSHRLIVFPRDTYKSGNGAIMDIKWDVLDARNGNVEWSVYTRTPVLSKDMKEDEAVAAGKGLAAAIFAEMQARAVVRR